MFRSPYTKFYITSLSDPNCSNQQEFIERGGIPAITCSNASVLSYEFRIPTFAPGFTCLSSRFSIYVTLRRFTVTLRRSTVLLRHASSFYRHASPFYRPTSSAYVTPRWVTSRFALPVSYWSIVEILCGLSFGEIFGRFGAVLEFLFGAPTSYEWG